MSNLEDDIEQVLSTGLEMFLSGFEAQALYRAAHQLFDEGSPEYEALIDLAKETANL